MNDLYIKGKAILDKGKPLDALKLFEEGISKGDIYCIYGKLAANATMRKDLTSLKLLMKKIFPIILLKTEQNEPEACFIAGRCYETGIIGEADICKAIEFYTKAAHQNHSDAMFNLGCIMLNTGKDIDATAQEYFIPSAKLNNKNAQFALGFYYEQKGQKDQALHWYKSAAENGNPGMQQKYIDFSKKIKSPDIH